MSEDARSRILFVDDEPERLSGLRGLIESLGATTQAVHPVDLEARDLDEVHLVSVDQYLGAAWGNYLLSDDGPTSSATRAADGIAVAAAINSQLRSRGADVAVSLHTAEIDRLGTSIPRRQREPLLAASYDLDWVFRFDGVGLSGNLAERISVLSEAVSKLPTPWSSSADDFGSEWLTLPRDCDWAYYALQQIEDCRPPTHALSANTRGRAAVRWLAHRVLPYPTFLVDSLHVSSLLGATRESVLENPVVLEGAQYAGPLAAFDGPRWWRAAIQDVLFKAGTDEADVPADRVAALNAELGVELVPLQLSHPVVAYDVEGAQLPVPVDRQDAVRLQPDGWPVFADDPWALRSEVAVDDDLAALVSHADRLVAEP